MSVLTPRITAKPGDWVGLDQSLRGLGLAQRELLRQILASSTSPIEDAFHEQLPKGSAFPTTAIWYADSTKARRLIAHEVTYNAVKEIETSIVRSYAADGTLDQTITDTIVYANAQPWTTTRVVS